MIEKKPFRSYNVNNDTKKDSSVVTIWLNESDRKFLDHIKNKIEQPKDSTAIKQLFYVGAKLLGTDPTSHIIETLFKNRKKNKRTGNVEFED